MSVLLSGFALGAFLALAFSALLLSALAPSALALRIQLDMYGSGVDP